MMTSRKKVILNAKTMNSLVDKEDPDVMSPNAMSKVSDVLPPPVKKTNRAVFKKGNRKLTASDSLLLKCSEVISSVRRANVPPPAPVTQDSSKCDADTLFGKTMSQMIKAIPDGISKEMAKIDCQQVLLQYRFQQPIQRPI